MKVIMENNIEFQDTVSTVQVNQLPITTMEDGSRLDMLQLLLKEPGVLEWKVRTETEVIGGSKRVDIGKRTIIMTNCNMQGISVQATPEIQQ